MLMIDYQHNIIMV